MAETCADLFDLQTLTSHASRLTDLCRLTSSASCASVFWSKSDCSPDFLFGRAMSSSASAITAVNIFVGRDVLLGYMDAIRPTKRMRSLVDTEPNVCRSLESLCDCRSHREWIR